MRYFYTCFVQLYRFSAFLAAPFNSKAKKWVSGRKNIFITLSTAAQKHEHWIWFHAASLGEFEQGRPLIESIKSQHPQYHILLTFFSPSGYEIRKDYPLADCVAYLPADTAKNAERLLTMFKPEAAFFIKYEFWFNYIEALHRHQIPLFYISAKFRAGQHFFRWYGAWFRKQLSYITHLFLQDENSARLLQAIGIKNFTVTGDTRFDRVVSLARQVNRFPQIEQFKHDHPLLIAGSTWPPDEALLLKLIGKLPEHYRLIIAPHDVAESHIKQLTSQLPVSYQRYSSFDASKACRILIIDSIGILSQLYQYADFVYIGGGFGVSIHNIQEPITFGCPVIFGPKYQRFSEAVDLVQSGGAFRVRSANELVDIALRFVSDPGFRQQASVICKSYVGQQQGATDRIIQALSQQFFTP
ncbi:MAG: 3-deoxy-D-manno-octulosonic acid transferase [Bacteroidetes bacterium]|nr:3-deoxy-D-manno-octulosonic acid transferase [Bacteroidota bacterium]